MNRGSGAPEVWVSVTILKVAIGLHDHIRVDTALALLLGSRVY